LPDITVLNQEIMIGKSNQRRPEMTSQNQGWQFTNTNEVEWKQAADKSLFKLIGSVDCLAFSISDVPAGHRGISPIIPMLNLFMSWKALFVPMAS
jgi:hypothetical protein